MANAKSLKLTGTPFGSLSIDYVTNTARKIGGLTKELQDSQEYNYTRWPILNVHT